MVAGSDATKWEAVEELNVMVFLNYLSLHKQKNYIEKKIRDGSK